MQKSLLEHYRNVKKIIEIHLKLRHSNFHFSYSKIILTPLEKKRGEKSDKLGILKALKIIMESVSESADTTAHSLFPPSMLQLKKKKRRRTEVSGMGNLSAKFKSVGCCEWFSLLSSDTFFHYYLFLFHDGKCLCVMLIS